MKIFKLLIKNFNTPQKLVIIVFVLRLILSEMSREFDLSQYMALFSIEIFAVFIPCIVYIKNLNLNINSYAYTKKINKKILKWCIISGISVQPLAMLANLIVNTALSGNVKTTITTYGSNLFLSVVVICVVPAICEELLMRGIFLKYTEQKRIKHLILLNAFVFALLHTSIENFAGVFILGIVLTYSVLITRSNVSSVVIHLSFNLGAVVAEWAVMHYAVIYSWISSVWMVIGVSAIGFVYLIVAMMKIKKISV